MNEKERTLKEAKKEYRDGMKKAFGQDWRKAKTPDGLKIYNVKQS